MTSAAAAGKRCARITAAAPRNVGASAVSRTTAESAGRLAAAVFSSIASASRMRRSLRARALGHQESSDAASAPADLSR